MTIAHRSSAAPRARGSRRRPPRATVARGAFGLAEVGKKLAVQLRATAFLGHRLLHARRARVRAARQAAREQRATEVELVQRKRRVDLVVGSEG